MTYDIKNKVILITGGGGFLGSALCKKLSQNNKIIVLDHNENNCRRLYDHTSVITEVGPIEDENFINLVFRKHKPEVVFHCAAHKHVITSEQNPVAAMNSNIMGTLHLLRASEDNKVDTFIFISTDKAEKPANVYGETKYISEQLVKLFADKHRGRYLTCRFCNLYGSSGSVVEIFRNRIAKSEHITVAKNAYRYFIDVDIAVRCLLYLLVEGQNGRTYLASEGVRYSIEEIAKRVCAEYGKELEKDIPVTYTTVAAYEKEAEDYLEIDSQVILLNTKKFS